MNETNLTLLRHLNSYEHVVIKKMILYPTLARLEDKVTDNDEEW